ncbi:MAG: tetratricopeptide repeat protein [Bdellovibrionales bacterium]|nr:tetratricopeptide repeat protein [Bdellovibrionales bacterium]
MKKDGLSKFMVLSLTAFLGDHSFSAQFDGSIELASRGSHSRLELSIDSSFSPRFTDSSKGFRIEIPSATLMDVGVPFGSEKQFNEYLETIRDERISGIRVRELESSLVVEGDYRFPAGKNALATPKMEHFDFKKEEAGRFVVDFFYQKGPTLADIERTRKESKGIRERAATELLKKKELEKRVAREKRIQDGRNAMMFCDQPFDRTTTVFLKFRAEHPGLSFSSYFPEKIPDHRFRYSDPLEKGEAADMVRLALKLSRENKHALTVRTVEFLEKDYPKSRDLNEMLFLKANAYFRMGYDDRGKALLQSLARTARGTEVGLQTAGFLAARSFQNQDWLAALEAFLNLKKEMPEHPLVWLFRYGIAESLYRIKQGEQAQTEYEWLSKNAQKPEVRAEAAFKIGDIYFERGQFAQAVSAYQNAIKGRESYLPSYPAVLLNLGESYFQLEELSRAEDLFKRFMDIASGNPMAWRASLRLAEIKAMGASLNADAEKAFMETINRYPLSQGALISRIRLLPCGRHGGFDLPAAERLISSPEVLNFPSDGAIYPSQFRELAGLTEVRMLISFGENQRALERGMARLRENPGVETRKLIEQAMIGGIKSILEKKLGEKDVFGAIAFFEKYGDFLPLPAHDPLADDLKIRLATLAAERNLTQFALKIIEPYRRMSEAGQKEVLAAIEKHVTLEGLDDQEERNLVEAKTLWNSADFTVEDASRADQLVARLGYIREDSRQAFEKNLILALYYREKKDFKSALTHARRLGKQMQAVSPGGRVQVDALIGDVALLASDLELAREGFRRARIGLSTLKGKAVDSMNFRHLDAAPSISFLVQSEGEVLEKLEKWKEAVALYAEAVENKIGGNHILYSHAKAILRDGGKESEGRALVSLKKIEQSQDDDVWKRLAQEKLKEIAKEGKVDGKSNP